MRRAGAERMLDMVTQKVVLRCLAATEELECEAEICNDRGACLKLQKFLRRGR